MKIGKIPEATLKKVILEQLGAKRDEVLIGPGHWRRLCGIEA